MSQNTTYHYVVFSKDLYRTTFQIARTPEEAAGDFVKSQVYCNEDGSELSDKIFQKNLKVWVLNIETNKLTKLFVKTEYCITTQEYSEELSTAEPAQEELNFFFKRRPCISDD